MNILSLFDGCSCGQVALKEAGISVDNYYASEIDKHAIKITQKNFPSTIQLGDVCQIDVPVKPDLIMAGSPCQGLSYAGKGLGVLKDERSKLFFEFIKQLNTHSPKYFLLENTMMKDEDRSIIDKEVGCSAVEINSSLFSAQNRRRLYWTNIPIARLPTNNYKVLQDVLLEDGDPRLDNYFLSNEAMDYMTRLKGNNPRWKSYPNPLNGKAGCLTAVMSKGVPYGVIMELKRFIHPIEAERLQCLPDNYTEGVVKTHRYKMLGNGWTVGVIRHILAGIKI